MSTTTHTAALARRGHKAAPAPAVERDRAGQIVAVAAEIFAREGYRNTDMEDVARALSIGKGSIYRRFPTKADLFLAAVDSGMRAMRSTVRAAADAQADPLDQVAAAVRAYLGFFAAHPHFVELLIQERAEFRSRKESTYFAHRKTSLARWRRLYSDLMAEGRLRRMPVDRITDVLSNLMYGTMFTNYFAGTSKSPEAQARDILDIVFGGIVAPGSAPARRSARGRRKAS